MVKNRRCLFRHTDMYPQFWTSRIGGIFVKYSYEYKKQCIDLYREGKWAETPEGIKTNRFHKMVRDWSRLEIAQGPEALKHKSQNKTWTADEKYELVAKVLAGASISATAISAGIDPGLLCRWVRCYKIKGLSGTGRTTKRTATQGS